MRSALGWAESPPILAGQRKLRQADLTTHGLERTPQLVVSSPTGGRPDAVPLNRQHFRLHVIDL
jgi:hypothetical protein